MGINGKFECATCLERFNDGIVVQGEFFCSRDHAREYDEMCAAEEAKIAQDGRLSV